MQQVVNNFKRVSLAFMLFYTMYLGKSALGINLSDKYTVPYLIKLPLVAMDCVLPVPGSYCHHLKRNISSL